jgi:hypothetical protein
MGGKQRLEGVPLVPDAGRLFSAIRHGNAKCRKTCADSRQILGAATQAAILTAINVRAELVPFDERAPQDKEPDAGRSSEFME